MRAVPSLPLLTLLALYAPGGPVPCEVTAARADAPHTAATFAAELAKLGGDLEPDDGVRGAEPGLPDRRLYPPVPLSKIAARDGWPRPRALVAGDVTYLRAEDDGDTHFVVGDGTSRVVCEIVPELPLARPPVGQSVKVWGIPRWDGEHKWGELHPVVGWVQAPKADPPKAADPAPAPPLHIAGETTVPAYKLVRLSAENADPAAALLWDVYPDTADVEELGDHILFTGPPGAYTVKLRSVLFGGGRAKTTTVKVSVTVTGAGPTPGPGPGPDPGPTPGPTPTPAPIPAAGLHVMVVYETADLPRMPRPQLLILYSDEVRSYLGTHCPAGPDGKTPEYRFFDPNVHAAGAGKVWADALARPRQSLPWCVISNPGKGGFEGPLPPDVPSFLALVKKFE